MCFPPAWGMLMSPAGRGRNAPALALPPPCPLLRVQGPVPAVYRQCVLAHAGTRQVIAYHCVLAHAGAPHVSACHCEPVRTLVWQSVLLRQHKTKSNTLGKYGKAANLPRESVVADADTPHVSACHCEPVRTLVWQSVLLRQHKPKSSACGESATACALTPVPPSCTRAHLPTFCMSLRGAGQPPRDVAIRTPAAAQNEKQFFPANP